VNRFIEEHHASFGVEPICAVLQVAPSTFYAAKSRPLSARAVSDTALKVVIAAIHAANYGVYGVVKMWHALGRAGHVVGRDQTARLMRELGLRGATRGRHVRTTRPDPNHSRAPDLVKRRFTASRPNELWVADFTYVPSWSGFVYVAFITDVFARRIVGWRASTTMRTELVVDALNMAAWSRRNMDLTGVICHSDAGSQYTSIVYTDRLAEIGAAPSIGTVGDSFDNALAETVNGAYKNEVIHRRGPWRDVDHVEIETLNWVHWFNHERLHESLGHVPPVEFETRWENAPIICIKNICALTVSAQTPLDTRVAAV
jgi:putative transposase